jgi:hypothetical protein
MSTQPAVLNPRCIVHLTQTPGQAIVAYIHEMARDPHLRVFHEVYLRPDIGLELIGRPKSPMTGDSASHHHTTRHQELT